MEKEKMTTRIRTYVKEHMTVENFKSFIASQIWNITRGHTAGEIFSEALFESPDALRRRIYWMIVIALAGVVAWIMLIAFGIYGSMLWVFLLIPIILILMALWTIRRVGLGDYTIIEGKCTATEFGLQVRVWRGRRLRTIYIKDKNGTEYKIGCKNERLRDTRDGDTIAVYVMGTPMLYDDGNMKVLSTYAALEVVAHKAE